MQQGDGSSRAGLGRRLLLVMVSASVGLLLAEALLRWLAPAYLVVGDRFYQADPELGFTLAPDFSGTLRGVGEFAVAVRTDNRGLRGASSTASGRGLLGLGDSYAFGWGVEEGEAYLSLLAARRGLAPSNAGVPGYGVCQAVDRGLPLAAALAPRLILLTVFAGNDETDELRNRAAFRVVDGRLGEGSVAAGWWPAFRRRVNDSSHLVRTVRRSPLTQHLVRRLGLAGSRRNRMVESLMVGFRRQEPLSIAVADDRLRGCVERLRDVAAGERSELAVILLPASLEMVPSRLSRALAAIGEPAERFDTGLPRRRLATLLAATGVQVIDVTPALAAAASRGERTFYDFDGHLTPAGHRSVAAAVETALAGQFAS